MCAPRVDLYYLMTMVTNLMYFKDVLSTLYLGAHATLQMLAQQQKRALQISWEKSCALRILIFRHSR